MAKTAFDRQLQRIKKLENDYNSINEKLKDAKYKYHEAIDALIALMDDAGTTQIRSQVGEEEFSASITETTVGSIEDFDVFWKWARRMNKPYLFQRRINNAPFRDELTARKGKNVPGVKPYVQRTLSIRKRTR